MTDDGRHFVTYALRPGHNCSLNYLGLLGSSASPALDPISNKRLLASDIMHPVGFQATSKGYPKNYQHFFPNAPGRLQNEASSIAFIARPRRR